MDFVHDRLFDGRKLRVLTIVDTLLALFSGDRSAAELQGRRRRSGA